MSEDFTQYKIFRAQVYDFWFSIIEKWHQFSKHRLRSNTKVCRLKIRLVPHRLNLGPVDFIDGLRLAPVL